MKKSLMMLFLSLLSSGVLSFAAIPVSAVVSTSNSGTTGPIELNGYYSDYRKINSVYEKVKSFLPLNIEIQMDETVDSIEYDLHAVRYYYGKSSNIASVSSIRQLTASKKIPRPSTGKFSYQYTVCSDSAKYDAQRFYEIYDGAVAVDSAVEISAWVAYKLKGENKWHTSDRFKSATFAMTLMRTVRVTTIGKGSIDMAYYKRDGMDARFWRNGVIDTLFYVHPEARWMHVEAFPGDSAEFECWATLQGNCIGTRNPDTLRFRGDTAVVAKFKSKYARVTFPQKTDEVGGNVLVVNNTSGAMLEFTQTQILKGSRLTFSATPNDGYSFECWARQANNACVSTANPLNFVLSQDTSLYAKFARPPFQTNLRLTYKVEGSRKVVISDTSLSEIELMYMRDSLGFITSIKGGPTAGYIYCQLEASPNATFDAATLVSSRSFRGQVIDAYVKDSMAFSLGISKAGVFLGKKMKFDPYTYFRMKVYSDAAAFDTLYSKAVRITWYNPISFINANGFEIWAEAKPSTEKVSVPDDRSMLGLPRETDSTRYSYHWESVDGKRIESTTKSIYATDTAHYRLVADSLMFRVRYRDYKGYVYKTEWLDSNTTISDAPKPNTLQDAAYWIRAIGGSRDLPLVLKGPVDIHAAYDYKVRFFDYDGNELSEGFVGYGKAATPPETEPTRDGYVFSGWDKAYDNVTDTMTVWATYEKAKSSSSDAKSSSSVKSSSSSATSSSSVKSSSSSAKSSSSTKSSSSKGKDALPVFNEVPQFSLAAVGRDIVVAGARVGSAYAVLDMQGRVLKSGRVNAASFSLVMNRAATYLVRVGDQTQAVKIK